MCELGGHTAASYKRNVVAFHEMTEYLAYDNSVTLFVLGAETDEPVVMEQIRGTFIGGRSSRWKTAVFLGRRLSNYLKDRRAMERDGFSLPALGLAFDQMVAMITYVDDGSFGSFIFCRVCLGKLAVKLWGSDMSVTEEEYGEEDKAYRMRFLDSMEEYSEAEDRFSLQPVDRNEAPVVVGTESLFVARFAGPQFVGCSHRYLRGLFLGKLSRIHQIVDDELDSVVPSVGRMLVELLEAGHSVLQLRRALSSLRQAWARPAVTVLLKMLGDADSGD